MTPRLPWPLPAPPPPRTTPPVHATTWEHTRWQWEDRETAVLHRLADHGGDLTAHRTVHLEDR